MSSTCAASSSETLRPGYADSFMSLRTVSQCQQSTGCFLMWHQRCSVTDAHEVVESTLQTVLQKESYEQGEAE